MNRTRITSVTQLKELFVETLINNTDKVTKVSDGSVLNGIAFGVAKIAQKSLKDIALVEARQFPSTAFGVYLDDVAAEMGIAPRFQLGSSSTYILLVGDEGTEYVAGTHTFTGNGNVVFDLIEDVTIPVQGYIYALVRSATSGAKTNVDPLTIGKVTPVPSGHVYVINEFGAIGGADVESDEAFQIRIRDTPNLVATDTLGRLTQVFIKINQKVMRLFYYGINDSGQTKIAVLTQDGSPLSNPEINDILVKSAQYLSLSDLKPFGSSIYSISIQNIDWHEINVDFRADIHLSYDVDVVRKAVQIAMSKYLDYRVWTPVNRVEWDDLLSIAKSVEGMKYVPDAYFNPRVDISISSVQLPRIKSFIMRDMNGEIISDGGGLLNPTYFPNKINTSYQATVLVTS